MRPRIAALPVVALLSGGCGNLPGTLLTPPPLPAPPQSIRALAPDPGFPIKPRPPCSEAVQAALSESDPVAITRVAQQGGSFTCGPTSRPLPLDDAIEKNSLERVRALLQAGADPNARWFSRGDRFALQAVIETGSAPGRADMLRLLLRHGADPNQRWCPFESRGSEPRACKTSGGTTPLMMAAARNAADFAYLLLEAGADPTLKNSVGATALDFARGEAVFDLLLAAMFQDARTRDRDALEFMASQQWDLGADARPWEGAPLARAITTWGSARPTEHHPTPSIAAERTRLLIGIGANVNERFGSIDWTPLALALWSRDSSVVKVLLASGADPNARWCTKVEQVAPTLGRSVARFRQSFPPGCVRDRGMTPLMFAASVNAGDLTALLQQHNADSSLEDWEGRTAAAYAELGRPENRSSSSQR